MATKAEPLWADLLNSDWHDHLGSGAREDRIGNDRWLGQFLARAGWAGELLPVPAQRGPLRALRGLLRRLVEAILGRRPIRAADLAALNQVLAGTPSALRLEPLGSGWRLTEVHAAQGLERIGGQVAASFARMLAEGDPRRIKICANPDCRWVIYDESRNRSRRWCDSAECGNLIKVRRHRQRRSRPTSARATTREPLRPGSKPRHAAKSS